MAPSVVWARDMGVAKNQELIDYYKDRKVWLVEPDERPVRVTPYAPNMSSARPTRSGKSSGQNGDHGREDREHVGD